MGADTKGANISRMVLKQAGRAKEKILQNLGKADKTTDEIFEEHLQNFNTQQVNATRLHKDINNYLRCIRAMQTASKNLMETLSDIYEKEWVGQDMLYVQAQNNEMLWADLAHKLSDQVVIPLNTYQAQFPEMRKKIDKRGRKLIDFDAERHAVQQMQNNPNRNEAKFVRAKESMENAKRTYEILNSELHDELPALHDSRILFLVTNMQLSLPRRRCSTQRQPRFTLSWKVWWTNLQRKLRGALCQGKRSQSLFQSQTTAATSATTSYQPTATTHLPHQKPLTAGDAPRSTVEAVCPRRRMTTNQCETFPSPTATQRPTDPVIHMTFLLAPPRTTCLLECSTK